MLPYIYNTLRLIMNRYFHKNCINHLSAYCRKMIKCWMRPFSAERILYVCMYVCKSEREREKETAIMIYYLSRIVSLFTSWNNPLFDMHTEISVSIFHKTCTLSTYDRKTRKISTYTQNPNEKILKRILKRSYITIWSIPANLQYVDLSDLSKFFNINAMNQQYE